MENLHISSSDQVTKKHVLYRWGSLKHRDIIMHTYAHIPTNIRLWTYYLLSWSAFYKRCVNNEIAISVKHYYWINKSTKLVAKSEIFFFVHFNLLVFIENIVVLVVVHFYEHYLIGLRVKFFHAMQTKKIFFQILHRGEEIRYWITRTHYLYGIILYEISVR